MKKEKIINKIKELITKATEPTSEILVIEDEKLLPKAKNSANTTLWFKVGVKDPRLYINHDGEGISALNHLAKKIIETELGVFQKDASPEQDTGFDLLVDINNFQRKKIENIHATVHMMAERARYFKSNIEIDPMSAFERRIVHEFLSDATDLKTESKGVGHERRVVIKYIGNNV